MRELIGPCLRTAGAGEPVAESPYYLRVLPAEPQPRRSRVVGDGRSSAVDGAEAVFHVETRDDYGNRCRVHVGFRHDAR